MLEISATEVIKTLMLAGTMVSINQEIDFETAAIVAAELGFEVEAIKIEDVVSKILEEYDEEESENEIPRPPVVTVMPDMSIMVKPRCLTGFVKQTLLPAKLAVSPSI